jgi:hypothetical protein
MRFGRPHALAVGRPGGLQERTALRSREAPPKLGFVKYVLARNVPIRFTLGGGPITAGHLRTRTLGAVAGARRVRPWRVSGGHINHSVAQLWRDCGKSQVRQFERRPASGWVDVHENPVKAIDASAPTDGSSRSRLRDDRAAAWPKQTATSDTRRKFVLPALFVP